MGSNPLHAPTCLRWHQVPLVSQIEKIGLTKRHISPLYLKLKRHFLNFIFYPLYLKIKKYF